MGVSPVFAFVVIRLFPVVDVKIHGRDAHARVPDMGAVLSSERR
jgi:hypothetical protein